MAGGNGGKLATEARDPAQTRSKAQISAESASAHDRRMARIGSGGELAVELISLPTIKTTGKGGRFISLDARMADDPATRREVTLWNEAADQFQRSTSFLKLSGNRPLSVTFRGAFRKRGAYCPERNTRLENWIFNAKSFDIDWLSPAGRAAHPATLRIDIVGLEERVSSVSKQPFLVVTGIDDAGRRHRIAAHGAARTALRGLDQHAQQDGRPIGSVQLDGQWRVIQAADNSRFKRTFTAQDATVLAVTKDQPQPDRGHPHEPRPREADLARLS